MITTINIENDIVRNKAVRGSLWINDSGEANFRPFTVSKKDPKKRFKKLAHGKVSRDSENTRFTLVVAHAEGVDAVSILNKEMAEAQLWLAQ